MAGTTHTRKAPTSARAEVPAAPEPAAGPGVTDTGGVRTDVDLTDTTSLTGADTAPAEEAAQPAALPAAKPPALDPGDHTAAPWREHALTRITELQTLANWLGTQTHIAGVEELCKAINVHLHEARDAAEDIGAGPIARLRYWWSGATVERAESNIDAAEVDLLRLGPMQYVRGQMPSVLASARQHLHRDDPRRVRMEELARAIQERDLKPSERGAVVAAARAASSESRREVMRVRSFRNVLLVAAGLLTLATLGLAILGWRAPTALPLCFTPGNKVVCPTAQSALSQAVVPAGADAASVLDPAEVTRVIADTAQPWDLALVALVGLIAGAVAAAVALRNIRGTSTPYDLPFTLAVLKLPTGALTAILGLLLMRGQFIPGLSALDFPAQILAWAVLFGYAQELFTRLVDRQAQSVLENVRGQG